MWQCNQYCKPSSGQSYKYNSVLGESTMKPKHSSHSSMWFNNRTFSKIIKLSRFQQYFLLISLWVANFLHHRFSVLPCPQTSIFMLVLFFQVCVERATNSDPHYKKPIQQPEQPEKLIVFVITSFRLMMYIAHKKRNLIHYFLLPLTSQVQRLKKFCVS